MEKNYVVIMAGGIGSRFWPESRTDLPKQFLDILNVGKSLLQLTYDRFLNTCPKENLYIVTNQRYSELVSEQLPDLPVENILTEPLRKNTAPCVLYASYKIMSRDPEARIIVSPSDHLVTDEKAFNDVMQKGLEFADHNDALLTIGIKPSRPETNYGYVQFEDESPADGIHKVKTFTEKPTVEIARKFLDSGDFLWNAGIFIWHVKSIMSAFQEHLGEMVEIFAEGEELYNTPQEGDFIAKAYSLCTNISIDFAVMEKATNVFTIPASFGWSDLGTWISLYDTYEKDYLGNAVSGKKVMVLDAANCMVMAPDDKVVVLQGLDDFCVIDTKNVLLICKKEKESDIKQMAAEVRKKFGEDYL